MKTRRATKRIAVSLALSVLMAGSFSTYASADVLDDVKEFFINAKDTVVGFLDEYGVTSALKNGYDRVTDFIFTYETQPDDPDMENLARSWAVTAWLADKEKEDTNIYYFDNHSLTMVEDLAKISGGYNLRNTPEGSFLNGKNTGILKATVRSASSFNVEWVNYEEEASMYFLQKMRGTNKTAPAAAAETEEASAQ